MIFILLKQIALVLLFYLFSHRPISQTIFFFFLFVPINELVHPNECENISFKPQTRFIWKENNNKYD